MVAPHPNPSLRDPRQGLFPVQGLRAWILELSRAQHGPTAQWLRALVRLLQES